MIQAPNIHTSIGTLIKYVDPLLTHLTFSNVGYIQWNNPIPPSHATQQRHRERTYQVDRFFRPRHSAERKKLFWFVISPTTLSFGRGRGWLHSISSRINVPCPLHIFFALCISCIFFTSKKLGSRMQAIFSNGIYKHTVLLWRTGFKARSVRMDIR